jgi:FkbM family methyltransferase
VYIALTQPPREGGMGFSRWGRAVMLKTKLRALIRNTTGYDIHKLEPGKNAFNDIKKVIGDKDRPVLFDVGANTGQTVDDLLRMFPNPQIHAFEPGAKAFRTLHNRHAQRATLNNFGLGSGEQERLFFESQSTDMSSFLPTGADGWGNHAIEEKPVKLSSLDSYCTHRAIDQIDLLKTDTQGFDLEVLKGSQALLTERRIRLIYTELNFA